MNIEIVNKRLLIDGKETGLKSQIYQHLVIGDLVVVVVGYLDGEKHTPFANVVLLNSAGRILWQIEEFKGVTDRSGYYTNVWLDDNGRLMAGNFLGFDCVIDIETGKILESKFTR
jgi:hypothetical protein